MENSTIPEQVLYKIKYSDERAGQIDWEGKKYAFCPNNNTEGININPTHIFDLGRKIGAQIVEGKISFLERVFLSRGIISDKGGEISIFIYRITSQWTKG